MEIFLEEHGESVLYGIVGFIMILTIYGIINIGIWGMLPDYKNDTSNNNVEYVEKIKNKCPTITAAEVIYVKYRDETFNCIDYIKARDYTGKDITDKVVIYGNIDVNTRGVYKLKSSVKSDLGLKCVKYLNIIVE